MVAHGQKRQQQESPSTADRWGRKSLSEQQGSKCTNQSCWITTNHSRVSCFIRSRMTCWPHRLKKTSSMQSKRRDLHHTWLHDETNEKLSFYCYSLRWITTNFSSKGTEKVPNNKSANDMFITRNKLFLRSSLVAAKRTRVSKFPVMIRTEEKKYALKNTIHLPWEGNFLQIETHFSGFCLFPTCHSLYTYNLVQVKT